MRVVLLGQAIIHQRVAWPEALRDIVAGADAVVCNFEGCLPPPGAWPMKAKTVHAMHPQALGMLGDLGVTHLGLANNHAWDFGHAGILSTRMAAIAAGFAVAGTGRTAAKAWAPAVRNGVALVAVDAGPTPAWAIAGAGPGVAALGLRHRIGFPAGEIARLAAFSEATGDAQRRRLRAAVGFDAPADAPRPFGLDLTESEQPREEVNASAETMERACRAIREARSDADLVVVAVHFHHWSPDWLTPPAWFGDVAAGFLDAGANAVVGTGPPWAFDPARCGTHLVAPGLGNLVFHTRRPRAYDAEGLPVWRGLAGIFDGGAWSVEPVEVLRPEGPDGS